ncbi:hypothetical protein BKA63DRAFT_30868 [Paraphoma chrysanthemicola]|nr:hypothetical protein BKA63DRAFT_30868 [Paraphoma chrysanthemicola]
MLALLSALVAMHPKVNASKLFGRYLAISDNGKMVRFLQRRTKVEGMRRLCWNMIGWQSPVDNTCYAADSYRAAARSLITPNVTACRTWFNLRWNPDRWASAPLVQTLDGSEEVLCGEVRSLAGKLSQ